MTLVIEAEQAALIVYKGAPSERNLQILRIARSKAQQTAGRCSNEYWTELSEHIQSTAIMGNIRGMYNGIKKALGPTLNKTAPLRSSTREVITDKRQKLDEPQIDSKDKDGSVQCLCHQHTDVQQRDMDHIYYARQEKRLNSFHPRSIRHILGISWLDRVSNAEVLSQATCQSMFTLLRKLRLRWLGHVYRSEDGQKTFFMESWHLEENQKPPTAALQRCLQESHENT